MNCVKFSLAPKEGYQRNNTFMHFIKETGREDTQLPRVCSNFDIVFRNDKLLS